MKKTVLSILAGLTVIGSASALPSPEDVKKMCDEHPDLYVWVEKTKACIPINPCTPDTPRDIKKAYCATYLYKSGTTRAVSSANVLEQVMNRYAEKVLQEKVSEINRFEDVFGRVFGGAKTEKGGYFVMEASSEGMGNLMNYYRGDVPAFLFDAGIAYGYNNTDMRIKDGVFTMSSVDTQKDCEDILDFAMLLSDRVLYLKWEYSSGICTISNME